MPAKMRLRHGAKPNQAAGMTNLETPTTATNTAPNGASSTIMNNPGATGLNSNSAPSAVSSAGGTAGSVMHFWRRAREGGVTDNAWVNLNEEYSRIMVMKEVLTTRVHRKRENLREELHNIKVGARAKVRSFKDILVHYLQLLLLLGPVVGCVVYVCREHPWLLLAGAVYAMGVVLYLLFALVVPTNPHRGVRWFKPYELGPEECARIAKAVNSADKRVLENPPQQMWTSEDKEKPLFILSLDGGGIRGAVTARILERISDEFPELMDRVGLVAGCSTGSIVGGMLATGFSPSETLEMFRVCSPLVFRKTIWGQLKQLGMLAGPNHDGEGKLAMLRTAFRGLRLGELTKGICITASHVKHNYCVPRIWTNVIPPSETAYVGHHVFDDENDDVLDEDTLANVQAHTKQFSVQDLPLADIVNGATAAPFYFPAFRDFVDGGLWSNDPSMAALAMAAPHRDLEKVHILSVSTGVSDYNPACRVGHWGAKQWLPWFVDFLFFATSKAAQCNCKSILGDRYHRVDPILIRPVSLNDVGALDELVQAADACDLEPTFRFLARMGLQRKSQPSTHDEQHQ